MAMVLVVVTLDSNNEAGNMQGAIGASVETQEMDSPHLCIEIR